MVKKAPKKKNVVKDQVRDCIERNLLDNPGLTLHALSKLLESQCEVIRSSRSVGRYCKAMRWSKKKTQSIVDHVHDPKLIKDFCSKYQNEPMDNIICIDEGITVEKDGHLKVKDC